RHYLPKERRERIKRDGSHYRRMLEELIQREVDAGRLPADTHCAFAAQSVIGLCNAWGNIIVRNDAIDIDRLAHHCLGLVLNGVSYGPPHQAAVTCTALAISLQGTPWPAIRSAPLSLTPPAGGRPHTAARRARADGHAGRDTPRRA